MVFVVDGFVWSWELTASRGATGGVRWRRVSWKYAVQASSIGKVRVMEELVQEVEEEGEACGQVGCGSDGRGCGSQASLIERCWGRTCEVQNREVEGDEEIEKVVYAI